MKLTKKRGIGAVIGIAVFLVAFGIAFAITYYQATITLPSGVTVQSTIILSGDNFSLWHDAAMTMPITGDLDLSWDVTRTQAPLGRRSFVSQEEFYIQNDSNLRGTPMMARPLAPCQELIRDSDGQRIGDVHAQMWADPDGDGKFDWWRGDACWDGWPEEWVIAPGEKWLVQPHPHFDTFQLLDGLNRFPLVVGGILWLPGGDAPSASSSADPSSFPGPDAHPSPSR